MQKDLELVNGLSLTGSEKKWYPSENSPQGEWDHIAEDMLLRFAESGHPIFRATTPLSRGKLKSKGKGKVSIHFSADPDTIDTIYRILLSVNQLSIYGAVAAICDEYEGQPDSTGGKPLYWRVNQLFSEKSKLKHLLVKNLKTPISFCRNIFNKSNYFHQKTDWVNSVRKQDL